MSESISNILSLLGCFFFTGFSIKAMDDYLDIEDDLQTNTSNLAYKLRKGTMPYAMFSFVLGSMMNHVWAAVMFCGAYVIGMVKDRGLIYPSGLKPIYESAAAVFVSIIFMGWKPVLTALLFIGLIQICDDIVDIRVDSASHRSNLVRSIGFAESLGIIFVLTLLLFILNATVFICGITAFLLLSITFSLIYKNRSHIGKGGDRIWP